ncbi:putative Palmitoyltransferase pfa3 [Blattamonas nauphoetae]|uniref:Palmitoyltransferase n=1 Tax=Blattamonas nauphoetae TaxID=2049346 RepID=A0ABQ9Y6S3_9EUKA|nr:putative Palmitoyltransferase pfa3 [Blattamonas nauphoetae]
MAAPYIWKGMNKTRMRSMTYCDACMGGFVMLIQFSVVITYFSIVTPYLYTLSKTASLIIGLLFAVLMYLGIVSYQGVFWMDPGTQSRMWTEAKNQEVETRTMIFRREFEESERRRASQVNYGTPEIPIITQRPIPSADLDEEPLNLISSQDSDTSLLLRERLPDHTTIQPTMLLAPPYTMGRVARFLGYSFCEKCQSVRPDRAHHCSICKRCIMRMDHHCPFTGNCVGQFNHKHFILFLIYTDAAAVIYIILGILSVIHFLMGDPSTIRVSAVFVLIICIIVLALALAAAMMLCTHCFYCFSNLTTLDDDDRQTKQTFKRSNKMASAATIFGNTRKNWWNPIYMPDINEDELYCAAKLNQQPLFN